MPSAQAQIRSDDSGAPPQVTCVRHHQRVLQLEVTGSGGADSSRAVESDDPEKAV